MIILPVILLVLVVALWAGAFLLRFTLWIPSLATVVAVAVVVGLYVWRRIKARKASSEI